jgi:hypothetical protein
VTTPRTLTGTVRMFDGTSDYSYVNKASLPTNDSGLASAFTNTDYTNVASVDGSRTQQIGTTSYNIFLFKKHHANNTDNISITWTGQSTLATSTTTATLQIYNYNSATWASLSSDSATAANTNFTLTGSLSSSVGNYYTANLFGTGYIISARVYQ